MSTAQSTIKLAERQQVLTFFVAQRNHRGEFLLSPRSYPSRDEAQGYIRNVLGGHGTVVLAAGKVEIALVKEEVAA